MADVVLQSVVVWAAGELFSGTRPRHEDGRGLPRVETVIFREECFRLQYEATCELQVFRGVLPVGMPVSELSSAERGRGRGHGGEVGQGGHPANWVCSLIKSKAGELRGCPVALHINDLSAF